MKIVLIDFISSGHHETYIKAFAESISKLNHQVVCFFPKEVTGYDTIQVKEETINSQNRLKVLNLWRYTKRELNKLKSKPDFIFFCWLDSFRFRKDHPILDRLFLSYLNHFFPYKWSGLYFHPVHLRNANHPLNNYANYSIDGIFSSANCKSICVLDEGVIAALNKLTKRPIYFFPDITNITLDVNALSNVSQHILSKASGRKIVSSIGMMQKRKGILSLLSAASKPEASKYYFVLAGPLVESDFTKNELERIKEAQSLDNVFCHFEKVQDGQEFNSLVYISDLIFAAYYDFPHSSNIMTKAAKFHKPIMVSKGYLMSERVETFQTGFAIEKNNEDEIIKGLCIIAKTKYYASNFENYLQHHDVHALQNTWNKIINAEQK